MVGGSCVVGSVTARRGDDSEMECGVEDDIDGPADVFIDT